MAVSADSTFSSVPILDYNLLSSPATRGSFVEQLQHALISVGFFYLANPPVPSELIAAAADYAAKFFEIPQEAKDAINMRNSESFLGYTRLGAERTKGRRDEREQFDFATDYARPDVKAGDPPYLRLWGPSQWPDDNVLPGFKDTLRRYLDRVENLSYEIMSLSAEALGLPPQAFEPLFGEPGTVMHRAKLVKYPTQDAVETDQGVGPHFDGGFLTLLLQASEHAGLQVQNLAGEWIDAPPIPNTFVVNIGKAMEAMTLGLARATSHRVLSPPKGSTPRYSIPFFQNTRQEVRRGGIQLEFPPEILQLKQLRGDGGGSDSVNYAEYNTGEPFGYGNLIGRIKSHPDVAERHYPEFFRQYFPTGLPQAASAY
ncbi:Clavaminate synthase-like protein [Punctularia strigosozonata HHB-11173 SS5]|uniref:Clavaminate synthase-like protein n=1 Tax=Punctularia strigosozonata (strain HHB-11173) TaxID=741275 RepID=UPI00044169A8|nr:Clavaminate synthase-like protein [Punctularia strigosozonata HHB-11173 SS5]EIN12096.1 Clavaminate synthase-like protein [Punctularia strigosozonata HHB-11173 SS5]